MPKNDQPRKLKIQPKYFQRTWQDAVFPEIRLAGKWLQDLGFVCGEFVTISLQDNAITIALLPSAEVQPTERETKREKPSSLPTELQNASGYEIFNERADLYRAWVENHKAESKKRKVVPEKATAPAATECATDHKIIQLQQEVDQAAENDNIRMLHLSPSQIAEGPNYDTIA